MTDSATIRKWYLTQYGEPRSLTEQSVMQIALEILQKWEDERPIREASTDHGH